LGKLAVPSELLDKPGKLTPREKSVIRCHTFFTRRALENISSFEAITAWSSDHHERLDGSGYPFHLGGRDLSLGARIVAVSDVFTAITEDRPYRAGMDTAKAQKVINIMAARSALDPDVVRLFMNNYEELNSVRISAQSEAVKEYGDICGRVAALAG
ncbi:MAG TPA: HD domain-containing phosphohydrolase, partial [Geobacteraceae bacterium]|nr:HD domain-containing phosphohydrolase [Geobacteraceae bacterium]